MMVPARGSRAPGRSIGVAWNYLQVEAAGTLLHPVVGPGGMTRAEAHAFVRTLLVRFAETAPFAEALIPAWDDGAPDDTVYAASFIWAIYAADDPDAGAREWVDDLARSLRRSGSKVRVAW
jgi:hypothetical protein